jgi:N4-gp56 family major capsid protein
MAHQYNAPNVTPSTVEGAGSSQMNVFFWWRKAIVDARKEMYFSPLADVVSMPKHMGKTIKVYQYVPLLDDRNLSDQGIDANGVAYTGAAGANPGYGNLYGSSKDVGTINGKLPLLTENGGRVNRVGFTRLMREGQIQKFGIFMEFTREALDFDSDSDLYGHISREMVSGAVQLTEAVLQSDLLAGAGVVYYSGAATNDGTITGEGATPSVVTYEDLMRLSIALDDNRTPKQTKIIAGSRMIDTRVISAGRVMYIGSELIPLVRSMVDIHTNPAFIPVSQYADAASIMNGELGTIDHFRLVVVPEMQHWQGAGAVATGANLGYRTGTPYGGSGTRYNIYPMLVVGDGSFSTVGFQSGGKTYKFDIVTKMPGKETADRNDPYGETGFSSIKWWYGHIILRPERLAVVKTVAPI